MSPIDRAPDTGMNAAMAKALRAERAAKQMTYDKLAKRSGIPGRTLKRLLSAQRTLDIAHVVSLAEALDIPIEVLWERAKARL